MASIYHKKNGLYQLSVTFQGKRLTRSLGTRSKETAKLIAPEVEKEIYAVLINGNTKAYERNSVIGGRKAKRGNFKEIIIKNY